MAIQYENNIEVYSSSIGANSEFDWVGTGDCKAYCFAVNKYDLDLTVAYRPGA